MNWQGHPDQGPSALPALDRELAAGQLNPLAHPGQPEAPVDRFEVEAVAVVLDPDRDRAVELLDRLAQRYRRVAAVSGRPPSFLALKLLFCVYSVYDHLSHSSSYTGVYSRNQTGGCGMVVLCCEIYGCKEGKRFSNLTLYILQVV